MSVHHFRRARRYLLRDQPHAGHPRLALLVDAPERLDLLIRDPALVKFELLLLLFGERRRDAVRAVPLSFERIKLGVSQQPEIKL